MLRTVRTFKAPLMGCALIVIILKVPLTRGLGLDPGTASKVYRCWSEMRKLSKAVEVGTYSHPTAVPKRFTSHSLCTRRRQEENGMHNAPSINGTT